MRRLTLLAMLAGLFGSGLQAQELTFEALFPMAVGNQWVWRMGTADKGLRETVTISQRLLEQGSWRYVGKREVRAIDREFAIFDQTALAAYYRDGNTFWYECVGVNAFGKQYVNRKLLLKDPVVVGTEWTDISDGKKCRVVSTNTSITIEGKAYDRVVVIRRVDTNPKRNPGESKSYYGVTYEYFCPTVGLIGSKVTGVNDSSQSLPAPSSIKEFFLILEQHTFPGDEGTSDGRPDARSSSTVEQPPELSSFVMPKFPEGFVYINPGTFTMGSPSDESGRESDEGPQHQVTITKGFYMSATEVTQEHYEAVMGKNRSEFKGPKRPVEEVTWYDAVEFCTRLSQREGLTPCYYLDSKMKKPFESLVRKGDVFCNWNANGYRLPTEAEWEYACRAGSTAEYCWGDTMDGQYSWYSGNSGSRTHDVGTRLPNDWGLYDMSGNVFEWCNDWYGRSYYEFSRSKDPKGPSVGSNRVMRGGAISYNGARGCRSAARLSNGPSFGISITGFRVVSAPG